MTGALDIPFHVFETRYKCVVAAAVQWESERLAWKRQQSHLEQTIVDMRKRSKDSQQVMFTVPNAAQVHGQRSRSLGTLSNVSE